MNLASIDLSILWPAFAAGLLVTATHVPLGMQVLARGIVFIDLAIAQIAGCGVLLADRLGFEAEGAAVQVAALSAALAGAFLLTWTERIWPQVQEAVIGVVFVLGATGGILLLASNPHGSEHLRDLLVGQVLWAQPSRLVWALVVYAAILAIWFTAAERIDPHRPAARHGAHATRAARRLVRRGCGGLRRGPRGVDGLRPAERPGDRVGAGRHRAGVVPVHRVARLKATCRRRPRGA